MPHGKSVRVAKRFSARGAAKFTKKRIKGRVNEMDQEYKVFIEEIEHDADYRLYIGRKNSFGINYICSCESERDAMTVRAALEHWFNTPADELEGE